MGLFSKLWRAITRPFRQLKDWLGLEEDIEGYKVEKQGSDHAIPVVYGKRLLPAIKVFKSTSDVKGGAKNELLHIVAVFCEGEVDAIEQVYFDEVPYTDAKWSDYNTVVKCTGSDDQAVPSTIVNSISQWTSQHKLSGLCYAYIQLKQNKKVNKYRGEPKVTALIRGKKVYDPRSGKTEYSNNPALCFYDYLTNTRYGKGTKPNRMLAQSFIDAANFCDSLEEITTTTMGWEDNPDYDWQYGEENEDFDYRSSRYRRQVEKTVTSYIPRMTCNVILDTKQTVFENTKILLAGMRGVIPPTAGLMRLAIESDGPALFKFDDENIIDGVSMQTSGKNDRYNQVIVQFDNEETNYHGDEVVYPPAGDPLVATWLSEDDDKELIKSIKFPTITNKAEAMQMAEIIAKRSRQDLLVTLTGTPDTLVVEPGDLVSIDNSSFGWVEKPFRVISTKINLDGNCSFEMREHQDSIYPWSEKTIEQDIPDTYLADPSLIEAPTGLSYTETPDSNNLQLAKLTWDDPSDALVSKHSIELYLVSADSEDVLVWSTETSQNSQIIEQLTFGEYRAEVRAYNSLFVSPAAVVLFTVAVAQAPVSLGLSATNFEIVARPTLANQNHYVEFELLIDRKSVV